ncbi:MAG: hypothetical protein ACI909_004134 [Planctomycetota bacterium]|jgi:hypothetical protein
MKTSIMVAISTGRIATDKLTLENGGYRYEYIQTSAVSSRYH